MTSRHRRAVAGCAAAVAYLCVVSMLVPFLVLAGAGATDPPAALPAGAVLCGSGGTAYQVTGITLSAEQMANAHTITTVTAARGLPRYAATVALTTAYTESTLINSTRQTDHDSEGLFQQRISIYPQSVATDPVAATNAFLDRLTAQPDWVHRGVEDDAQSVQISAYPHRYTTNQPIGTALTGLLWPTAAAAAARHHRAHAQPSELPVPPCAGDGPGTPHGTLHGVGDLVAGTTAIPPGLILSGTRAARIAVRYALAQLGKPYVFGAAGPNAYDCSGLTMAAWAAAGVALPHLAAGQTTSGTPEPADLSHAGTGDLVLIPGADGTPDRPGHVAMIIGRAAGRLYLIQAPGYRTLPVEITDASQWAGDIVAVRHIG